MRYPYPFIAMLSAGLQLTTPALAAPGDPVYETCPSAEDVGDNVECYPLTFTSKTEIHPDGIPIIGYLFVPKNRAPNEPLPAIVFAHGSGSMYSSGNHNKGLNSKQLQWIRQYTHERGIVSLHVSSFHSRYLLPDSPGDQRILDWEHPPEGVVGGDDYRATSTIGGQEEGDAYAYLPFDPEQDDFNDHNGRAGVSEIIERAYDMDAAWDFLAGIRKGRFITTSRNEDSELPTLRQPAAAIDYIGDIVQNGLVIDHERIFLYGTSHGGQTAMTAAHAPRALGDDNPMNADLPAGFDRHRYAAFFDYYGGCGLYGAYNGANFDVADPEDNSSWRPYNAFLMLHGENDPIWQESDTGTTREKWFAGECWPRIAAAKADPAFNVFLEAIIYAGAHHSFDGTERNNFTDENDVAGDEDYDEWIAKIHANERMTLGMIDAIGDIVSARRNSAATVPALAGFGFNEHNPYFSTIPLTPALPPRIDYSASTGGAGGIINIDNRASLENAVFSVAVKDPAAVHDIGCQIAWAPANITVSPLGSPPTACNVQMALSDTQQAALDINPLRFGIEASSALGSTVIPFEVLSAGTGATLRYRQSYSIPSDAALLSSDIAPGDESAIDARALAWSWQPALNQRFETTITTAIGSNVAVSDGIIADTLPGDTAVGQLVLGGHGSFAWLLRFTLDTINDQVSLGEFDIIGPSGVVPENLAPVSDFVTNYEQPVPVDASVPLPPGEFPEGTLPDSGDDEDPGDEDPGDEDPGDEDPGDEDPGDENPGDDVPGDDVPGDDDPGDGDTGGDGLGNGGANPDGSNNNTGNGGGGALFWLLPLALLFRRR